MKTQLVSVFVPRHDAVYFFVMLLQNVLLLSYQGYRSSSVVLETV